MRVDAVQEGDGGFVVRVLGYKFAVDSKVKHFGTHLAYRPLQILFVCIQFIYQCKPPFYLCHNMSLLRKRGKGK